MSGNLCQSELGLTTKPNQLGFIQVKAATVRRHPKVDCRGGGTGGLKDPCNQQSSCVGWAISKGLGVIGVSVSQDPLESE